jgi:diadenosine tetraphosphate (Ap4A) HIT family hydrolase
MEELMMNRFTRKGVTYLSSTGEVVDCLFCRINDRKEPGTIVYEDESFVVFKTIKPATSLHLLVTPRVHIQNVHSLKGEEGAEMVRKLKDVAMVALGEHAPGSQLCFHVPPLNSIDHLHLHAIAKPETMSFWAARKYHLGTFFCQSADAIIASLLHPQSAHAKRTKHKHSAPSHHSGHSSEGADSPGH